MTPIDPDAVIDAIARLFPDGFDPSYPDTIDTLTNELSLGGDVDHNRMVCTVDALIAIGRLRAITRSLFALSYTEQARRIKRALNIEERDGGEPETLIANVLAGKPEKL